MEISSMSGMQPGMSMGSMRPPPPGGDPAERAEEMTSKIMENQDSDGDGLLSSSEFDSELLAKIDEDGDGNLSQAELQAGIQSAMEEGKAAFESGSAPSEDNRAFMQQMHELSGIEPPPPPKEMAANAYAASAASAASSYNTDQLLLESLDVAV